MRLLLTLLACLLLPAAASAQEVVLYRCTDASGAISLQSTPCPKGSREEKKPMQGVSPSTPYAPAPKPAPLPAAPPAAGPPRQPPTSASDPRPADAIAATERLPPPALYQCTTYDKDSFITEEAEPQTRCAPMQVTGLDGNPNNGAGQACQVFTDVCARVPDGALCDAWRKTLREAETRWRFAAPENSTRRKQEYERVRRIVSESTCGATARKE